MIDRGCIQSPQVNIRAANVSDIPFIQGIARSTWADTYRGVIPEDAQAAVLNRTYSKEALSTSIGRNQAFLVAEVREAPGAESATLAAYVDVDFDGQQMNRFPSSPTSSSITQGRAPSTGRWGLSRVTRKS